MLPTISNQDARRLFLHHQGLCHPPHRKLTRQGLLALIEQIGFVQVDSINTVERAHHLILFARNQTYRQKQLRHLLERDASLFENWTHDASIIPTAFYPYWTHHFERERERLQERWRTWRRPGYEEMLEEVLERVRHEGPLLSRQMAEGETKGSGNGWWDWHPSKTALEYHWRCGALAVARRDGFQKVYDLTERVIPEAQRDQRPSREAFVEWACTGALERLGIATHGEIAAFWGLIAPHEAKLWCEGQGLEEVLVEAADGSKPRRAYARPGLLADLSHLPEPPKRLRVLSPFDPILRDRKRAQRLFNFDYRIEVFVPAAKRRYGYYVFPLLEGDRLIGRIDMKCERQFGCLAIKGLWLEPGCRFTAGRQARLEAELERLRRFAGADRLVFADDYLRSRS